MAKRSKMSEEEFVKYAEDAFVERICTALIESLLAGKGVKEEHLSSEVMRCIFDKRNEKNQFADLSLKLNVPIVGIGAPAKDMV